MGPKIFDFSSKRKGFCPKMTKFSPNLAFLSIAGSFGALLEGWLVVVARAVSHKTPIYFMINCLSSYIGYYEHERGREGACNREV